MDSRHGYLTALAFKFRIRLTLKIKPQGEIFFKFYGSQKIFIYYFFFKSNFDRKRSIRFWFERAFNISLTKQRKRERKKEEEKERKKERRRERKKERRRERKKERKQKRKKEKTVAQLAGRSHQML